VNRPVEASVERGIEDRAAVLEGLNQLSDNEIWILIMLAAGVNRASIARTLEITPQGIGWLMRNATSKMQRWRALFGSIARTTFSSARDVI